MQPSDADLQRIMREAVARDHALRPMGGTPTSIVIARAVWDAAMQRAMQICIDHRAHYTQQAAQSPSEDHASLCGMAEGADYCAEAIKDAMQPGKGD